MKSGLSYKFGDLTNLVYTCMQQGDMVDTMEYLTIHKKGRFYGSNKYCVVLKVPLKRLYMYIF